MATKAQIAVDAKVAQTLLDYVKQHFPQSGHDIDAVSSVVWMLIDQDIEPEVVASMDAETIEGYFGQVCDIDEMECEDIATDMDRQNTALGKRWRSIRHKVIRALI